MTSQEVINAPIELRGAQINDLHRKLLICEESENDTFRFPRSKKPWMDFLRHYQSQSIHFETTKNAS